MMTGERVTEFHLTTVHQGSARREVGGERVTEFHLTTVHQGSVGREVGGERVKVWHLMMYVCVCEKERALVCVRVCEGTIKFKNKKLYMHLYSFFLLTLCEW